MYRMKENLFSSEIAGLIGLMDKHVNAGFITKLYDTTLSVSHYYWIVKSVGFVIGALLKSTRRTMQH